MPDASVSNAGAATGLYGKLPCAGDFVTRSLPAAFVAHWDDWLQRALVASRAKLGSRWTQIYLESPVWRFALLPQVCGSQAWAGVLMPSVDRAGRYFPLTLAAPISPAASTLLTVTAAEHWFGQLEDIALWALQPEATLEGVEARLSHQTLAPVPARPDARDDWEVALHVARWWTKPGHPLSLRMASTHTLPAIAEFAAAHLMDSQSQGRTLWWMRDAVAGSITLRGWQGMPPPVEYATLLQESRDGAGQVAS
jgi:type VI secretion system protein ImpM